MAKFTQGDRVQDKTGFLGTGIVTDPDVSGIFVLVKWDENPPVRFNMGANPALIDIGDLAHIEEPAGGCPECGDFSADFDVFIYGVETKRVYRWRADGRGGLVATVVESEGYTSGVASCGNCGCEFDLDNVELVDE